MAQAGALASLEDTAFIASVVEEVARGRNEYYALAQRLGLSTVQSATNFVAIDVGDRARAPARAAPGRGRVRAHARRRAARSLHPGDGRNAEERTLFARIFEAVLHEDEEG